MKRLLPSIALALLVGLFGLMLSRILPPLRQLEASLFDIRVYFQPLQKPHPNIYLLQAGPEQYEQLRDFLNSEQARLPKAIGLDLPTFYLRLSRDLKPPYAKLVLTSSFDYDPHLAGWKPSQYNLPSSQLQALFPVGFSSYLPDSDGTIRTLPVQKSYRVNASEPPKVALSLGWQMYKQVNPLANLPRQPLYLHYPGPNQIYSILSIHELLALSPEELTNSLILISNLRTVSPHLTPYHSSITALELHAYTLSSLLEGKAFRHPELLNWVLPFGAALLTLLLLVLTLNWPWIVPFLALLMGLALYISLNLLLFNHQALWLDLVSPLLSMLGSSVVLGIYFYRTEGRERQLLLNTFQRHLPHERARALIEREQNHNLTQNERKIVTVMFTDIEGFSRMGEKLPPDQIMRILNEYLTAMTEIVFTNQGTLDKYIGDGIMAVYGNIGKNNPKEDAYYAVKTALEMQHAMERLQKKWVAEGLRPIQIRIGLNTGDALVGYVGHPERKEVTVIGDTVNTAARIEKLNKHYKTRILISHGTYEYVKERVEVHPIGEEKLKGKSSSVMVYQLIGWKVKQVV